MALFLPRCALLLALCTAACAQQPERPPLPAEYAASPAEAGALERYGTEVERLLSPGESAHWLLDRNELAFRARLALTERAAATLDIQYFIWEEDASGFYLAERLLAAADRGVKIRLLLDDFDVGRNNEWMAKLDLHPGIEVRLFNPWIRSGIPGKTWEFVTRWGTLTHRMHNKTYIADGRFAIVGGRNIGDRYFGVYDRFVQNDLDVMLAGPLVEEIAASFDLFWNAELTYRATDLGRFAERETLAALREHIARAVAAGDQRLLTFRDVVENPEAYLSGLAASHVAGPAELYLDSPDVDERLPHELYRRFLALLGTARREVLISSPYFVPDRAFLDLLATLNERGVRVALITNSLATNNHVVAHSGYKQRRRRALAAGLELYELKPDAASLALYVAEPVEAGFLGLHTKAIVIDDRVTFIGSPNVDPRSMLLNTEIGVVTVSEALARELGELIERDMRPDNAWRVTMDEEGWLEWSAGDEVLKRQPAQGFRQRMIEFLLNLLPLKDQV